ncbi:hypothetical protein PYCCODRAFT_1466041 [Trametes coccinea BRFM310]|uniref:Uncharacterized protein n=1 Tax=Trametes coccinea (strain BRFM310) TaxID=1353009 RepID=A0A1Y2IWI5_TRAC3|nr:hypothetical protein PYCCODRAFT_1466041 [Trametes coccinea BRFM310]
MQLSTIVKLALLAAHAGVVMAIPSALEERSFNGLFDNCTTDSDCDAGEICYDGAIVTLFGLPPLCIPDDWNLCGSGTTNTTTD